MAQEEEYSKEILKEILSEDFLLFSSSTTEEEEKEREKTQPEALIANPVTSAAPGKKRSSSERRKKQVCSAVKKHRIRRKEEVDVLRLQKKQLEDLLKELQIQKKTSSSSSSNSSSVWQKEALNQKKLFINAQQENLFLKQLLAQQLQMVQVLHKKIDKRKNICLLSEKYSLGQNQEMRKNAIEAIIKREYDRMMSILLQTGLYDIEEELNICRIIKSPCKQFISFELLKHKFLPQVDYKHLSHIAFKCFRGDFVSSFSVNKGLMTIKVLEEIDENTLYVSFVYEGVIQSTTFRTNLLLRRYIEDNRILFSGRSVMRDAVFPQRDDGILTCNSACIVIENVKGPVFGTRFRAALLTDYTYDNLRQFQNQVQLPVEMIVSFLFQNLQDTTTRIQTLIENISRPSHAN